MKYDVLNRLKKRNLPNGMKSTWEYDELDRIKSIVHTNAQGAIVSSVRYDRLFGIWFDHQFGNWGDRSQP